MSKQMLDGWDLHVEGGSLVSTVHLDNISIRLEIESGSVKPAMVVSASVTEKTTGFSYRCLPWVSQVASLGSIKHALSSREAREWLSLSLIMRQVGLSDASKPIARELIMNGVLVTPPLDANKVANLRSQLVECIGIMKEIANAAET